MKVDTLCAVAVLRCSTAPHPPWCDTGCLSGILRELVGEFSLSTNISATTTSLLRTLFDVDMGMVLEVWSRETDHQALEQQVQMRPTTGHSMCMFRHHKDLSAFTSLPSLQLEPHSAAGAGALEHDPHTLFTYEVGRLVTGLL